MAEILLENETIVQETETVQAESILAFPDEPVQADPAGEDLSEVVSDGDDAGISPFSVYDGSISSTYVEFFRGYAAKLPPDVHYVCYRDGQYTYVFYYSPDLEMEGSRVFGSADFYRLDTRGGYVVSTGSGSVSEDVHSGMVYSDLPGCPDLRGGEYYVQVSAVFVLCLIFVFVLLNIVYKLPKRLRRF